MTSIYTYNILMMALPGFGQHLTAVDVALLAAGAVLCIGAVVSTWLSLARVLRHRRRCAAFQPESEQPMPGVSVIVYSQDSAESLEALLPAIFVQQYNGPVEVVVVNDGESSSVHRVVSEAQVLHPNIYLTFAPDGARHLSRKKLALTLGVKAARHPIVVHIHACSTLPEDGTWLQRMMRHFADTTTDVVLGFATPAVLADGKGLRTLALDYAADSATWLTAALSSHPYMGTSYNLAYRRDVFFRNKGFSKSLQLNNGDDDIFVNEITDSTNTAVESAPEAVVTTHHYNAASVLRHDRLGHVFTGRYVRRATRRTMALTIAAMWLSLACCVAAVILNPLNAVVDIAAILIVLAVLIWPSVYWAKTVRALTGRRLRLTVPWLVLTRPVRNILLGMRALRSKNRNYTWTR